MFKVQLPDPENVNRKENVANGFVLGFAAPLFAFAVPQVTVPSAGELGSSVTRSSLSQSWVNVGRHMRQGLAEAEGSKHG